MKNLFLFIIVVFVSTVLQCQTKVACIGNSITEGYGLKKEETYPFKLQALMGDSFMVRNFGVSARTLLKKGDRPYWKEQKYVDVLQWNPDIVIIKLGTNDTKPHNWKFANHFVNDYDSLVQIIKNLPASPTIYLCYPIPVFEDKWGITDSIIINGIIPFVDIVSQHQKLPIIDLYHPLLGETQLDFDGIHPNDEGTKKIAQIIFNAIKP